MRWRGDVSHAKRGWFMPLNLQAYPSLSAGFPAAVGALAALPPPEFAANT